MVSRISPSQSAKISPPSSLAWKKSPLFQHARRFGKISQEAWGKHCHWLVSWLLGKTVPSAILKSLRPRKNCWGPDTTWGSSCNRKHDENRQNGRFGQKSPDIFCETLTNGASMVKLSMENSFTSGNFKALMQGWTVDFAACKNTHEREKNSWKLMLSHFCGSSCLANIKRYLHKKAVTTTHMFHRL